MAGMKSVQYVKYLGRLPTCCYKKECAEKEATHIVIHDVTFAENLGQGSYAYATGNPSMEHHASHKKEEVLASVRTEMIPLTAELETSILSRYNVLKGFDFHSMRDEEEIAGRQMDFIEYVRDYAKENDVRIQTCDWTNTPQDS